MGCLIALGHKSPPYGGQNGVKPPHSKAGETPAGEKQIRRTADALQG